MLFICALQIGMPGLASGSRLTLVAIVLPPTFDWRSLSTEFALPPRSPSRPDRYAADASGSTATCARHPGRGRTGPDFSCMSCLALCFCFIARTATVLSRGSQTHCHCWPPPLSPWLRAVHLLRHPFRWPLLSPTAIWDLKCLVSLSRQSALSTPIIDKTSLLSSPSFLR